ncbi:DUF1830 domain-containing protein [Synechococcus sp. BA-132 BA5]|uniref:DUF1830 domain-containing protein n=1 Tax=Synechococcus sp. BA-132 BA5 TaxID=3110252 RepID=UPI002B216EC3|nr:DUF1830 domain-containing protein [Synechococcus sp. BA-132 BA5]MEA5414915.1 DUF1830 domain-containing protein [Synechococcus sp. BA-132 BA5]
MTTGTCLSGNTSNQMVILRCIGPETYFQEEVVFPFEDWLFRCLPHSRVDNWTHGFTVAKPPRMGTGPRHPDPAG